MLNARLKNIAASGLVAAAALLGAVSPAQAVVYVGNFDPAFGAIFPNLGFSGTAVFSLPDVCNGLTGSFANSDSGCGGGAMKVTSAVVSFYNNAQPLNILQTLNFITPWTINSATLITPVGGGITQLTAVNSVFSAGVLGTIPESIYSGQNYEFYLAFSGGTASMFYGLRAPQSRLDCFNSNETCGFSKTSPTVTFTPAIPEPETYALMLAGLVGVAFMARRRRAN